MSVYKTADRVEVWVDGTWRGGKITHVGPTEGRSMGPMTLPGLADDMVRVLVDPPMGFTIQAPKDDPEVLRHACARKGCGRPMSEHEYGAFCP